jgi:hypothetical protein
MTRSIMVLLSLFFGLNSHALVTPNTAAPLRLDPFKIKPKDIEKITGKKLTLFQKIKLQLAQKVLRKYSDGETTARQRKQGRVSMILGILGLAFLFISLSPVLGFLGILAIPSAILAVVFGSKSLKGNSNSEGIIGVITGGVTIALFIIAIIVLAIGFSGFTFE